MGVILQEDVILYNSGDSWERNQKEKEYLEYIGEHIANVKKAFMLYFAPLFKQSFISPKISTDALHLAMAQVYEVLDTHDASKFSDSEFDAYRAKYHPTTQEKNGGDEYNANMEAEYELAWKHHYTVNEHHPEHWVNRNENGDIVYIEDMSLAAIVEMICDWEAMALKFNSSTTDWYTNEANDEKEAMTNTTRDIVEELLFNVIHH